MPEKQKPPFGPGELLYNMTDKENNLEIFVAGRVNGDRFSVSMRDNDSMEFLPTVRIFPYEKQALDYAEALSKGQKPP